MPMVALIPGAATRIPMLTAFVDGFPEGTHKLETITGGGRPSKTAERSPITLSPARRSSR